MNKFINVLKFIVNVIKSIWSFFTDKEYRDDFIFDYWTVNWKSKAFVFVLIPILLFGSVFIKFRGPQLLDCVMEQIDVGRTTDFSMFTGSCVIDSGKKDDTGNVIWVKVARDIAVGDFSAQ